MKKWTIEKLNKHLTMNNKDTYSMAVELSALYWKLYGVLPRFGLSGAQAEMVGSIVDNLPDSREERFIDHIKKASQKRPRSYVHDL